MDAPEKVLVLDQQGLEAIGRGATFNGTTNGEPNYRCPNERAWFVRFGQRAVQYGWLAWRDYQ